MRLSRLLAWLLLMAPSAWAVPLDLSSGHIPFVASLTTLFQLTQPVGGISYTPAGGSFTGGTITAPILAANGTACSTVSYSFSSFTTTGFIALAGPDLAVCVGGTHTWDWVGSQLLANTNGSAAAPVLANGNFTTTGPYWQTNGFGVAVGGQTRVIQCGLKTLSNTTATLTTLAIITLATSNTAGGASAFFSVEAIDGVTPHVDDDTQIMNFAFKNIAGTDTVGASSAVGDVQSGDLGTTTVGATATISGTTILINVTPVFTTIVPTLVHGYVVLQIAGPATVACQ